MNLHKKYLMIVAMGLLAFALFACNGQSNSDSSKDVDAASDSPIQQLSSGAVKARLDGGNDPLEFEVTVKDGESLVYVANITSDSDNEVEVVTTFTEGDSTDYFYSGYNFSSQAMLPGTYSVTVKPNGNTGEIIATSFDDTQIDLMNSESEEIFAQVSEAVGK